MSTIISHKDPSSSDHGASVGAVDGTLWVNKIDGTVWVCTASSPSNAAWAKVDASAAASANTVASQAVCNVTTRLLSDAADHGRLIVCTQSTITLTVPAGLRSDFKCRCVLTAAGTMTIAASGTTLNKKAGLAAENTLQWGIVTIEHIGGDVYVLSGDLDAS